MSGDRTVTGLRSKREMTTTRLKGRKAIAEATAGATVTAGGDEMTVTGDTSRNPSSTANDTATPTTTADASSSPSWLPWAIGGAAALGVLGLVAVLSPSRS